MPIVPLPQFEADLKAYLSEQDRAEYEALRARRTLVVRFGSMKYIGEFRNEIGVKPGCGSKVVVRTFRGSELGEMLTSTCPNSGCSKSVSRQEMLKYIDNSGGRDYPFYTEGKLLRIATPRDLEEQARLEQSKHELRARARGVVSRLLPKVKVVEVEPVLGGETLTVFVLSEERVELRDAARELELELRGRVEMRMVGARDEARLTADYEKCGQYCCCKNFLKVLRPVSMKSAKVQKATLDPLKISGRCGRLMCCLRYEDSTYEDLAKNLPRKKSRVGTPEGDGVVVDSQILTQLVLVLLDEPGADGKPRQLAVPVEELTPPLSARAPASASVPVREGRRPRGAPGEPSPMPPVGPRAPKPMGDRSPALDQRDGEDAGDGRGSEVGGERSPEASGADAGGPAPREGRRRKRRRGRGRGEGPPGEDPSRGGGGDIGP
jgi:cell fate regulator YaaT (PSP1 superfamily)